MPRLITLVSLLLVAILCGSIFAANGNLGAPPARVGPDIDGQPTIQSLSKMPLAFTKNMGQWDDRVLFRANSGGATMWFTKEGVTYQFIRRIDTRSCAVPAPGVGANSFAHSPEGRSIFPPSAGRSNKFDPTRSEPDSIDQLVLTAKFVGANPNPEIIAEGQMEYKCNYFLGNDPSKWHTDVPNYEAITLKDIYPGIDLRYSGDGNGQAAYEFIAAPEADIAQIKVSYEGAEETSLDSDGKMVLKTKWGDMTAGLSSPRPVGEGSGVRAVLSGTACLSQLSEHTLSSSASTQSLSQSTSGTLTLSYSTYLGGSGDDLGFGIAVDSSGSAYVAGSTESSNFPTQNPSLTHQGWTDAFVSKLNSTGENLTYSTYLGGGGGDYAYAIAVDGGGNVFVTGHTYSSSFPTLNPYQTYQGFDAFVTKLSSSGNRLIYSTYLGGGTNDQGNGIAVDDSGNAYVVGFTRSSNFPTMNPYQTDQGYDDAFVTKLSSSGNSLKYSTYLGGGQDDAGFGVAVDGSENAYVTGKSYSSDFPTHDPYQALQGGNYQADAFVAKLSSSGSTLIYSTYLGGSAGDYGAGIAVNGSGNAFVTGGTESTDFPTSNPCQADQNGIEDVFVAKLSCTGASLIYSTYLGGGGLDFGRSIVVDANDNAYLTGFTFSSDFPTRYHHQPWQGGADAFVTELSNSGSRLIYSTCLGGGNDDYGFGIAVEGSSTAYVTGYSRSSNFPTVNPIQSHQGVNNLSDVFVAKLTWTPDYSCGDVNTDEKIDLLDVVFLINYIFVGGPAPLQLSLADVNCSGSINIGDVVLLINYIFRSGPAPCSTCK